MLQTDLVTPAGLPSSTALKSTSQIFKLPQGQLTPTRDDTCSNNNTTQITQQSPRMHQHQFQYNNNLLLSEPTRSSRAYSFNLNQFGSGSNTNTHNREKSADRFIPQIKVSSNYYSLLLSESHQNKRRPRVSEQSATALDLDETNEQIVDNIGNIQTNGIIDESSSSSLFGNTDDDSTEDDYSTLLRNNIVKELYDFNNLPQLNSSNSTNSLKMHQKQKTKRIPKVLSYTRMNIARQHTLLAESDDIVFTQEPQEVRKISTKPYKILDAPGLSGDFYTNILDWTSSNLVVVALNNQIYTWSPVRHDVSNLNVTTNTSTTPNVVSLSCNPDGKLLATADEHGYVKLFDIEKAKVAYEFQGHADRIGAMAWNENILTTASKDFTIKLRDIRAKSNLSVLNFHKEQVCGIKWSEDGVCLASGGNDNKVCVYNHKMNKLSSVFSSHSGAVKALAWSPHKHNILVSGGGNKDQTLKFWNTQNNTLIKSIHTGSQVCNMVFSKHQNEVLTTHGFQLNQVSIWRADTYQQVATLYGHSERVLYLALSPDHEDIVTGSADETLRFWKVFNKKKKREESASNSSLDPFFQTIR